MSHVPRLVLSDHVRGTGVNTRVAMWVTVHVGTMWAAYLFCGIALISLPAALATRQPIVIVAWVAQTFLQLVLLPVILVGQNVQQAHNDARAVADHETLTALSTLNDREMEILAFLKQNAGTVPWPPGSYS